MKVIQLESETMLERSVRYGLVPESAIPAGMWRVFAENRRQKERDD
jgi:hypothetical protein